LSPRGALRLRLARDSIFWPRSAGRDALKDHPGQPNEFHLMVFQDVGVYEALAPFCLRARAAVSAGAANTCGFLLTRMAIAEAMNTVE
jgi:hypothetical protein